MNKKLRNRLLCTHSLLLVYIIIVAVVEIFILVPPVVLEFHGNPLSLNLFGTPVNLWVVLIIMYCLELLSTFTFQLRMKLTAEYEVDKKEKLIELIPLIAGFSWMVAGFQGIIFLTSDPWIISGHLEGILDPTVQEAIREMFSWVPLALAFLKLVPVFIATYNGVFTTLLIKNQTNVNKSV